MAKVFLLVLFTGIWMTLGHILFKKAANTLESPRFGSFSSCLDFARNILGMPMIWAGLASMGIGLVAWLMALAQADLSVVFPLGSIQYLLTLAGASFFLGERIDRNKLMGTLLLMMGIILVSVS